MRGPNDFESEANRYDGAPAPDRNTGITSGDAMAAAEEARENASCEHCGGDDDDLTTVAETYDHSCPAHQNQRPDPLLLCKDCREDHTPEEDFIEGLRESEDTVVLYECGITGSVEMPTIPDEAPNNHPSVDTRERIPVECHCGATIDEILY